MKKVIRLLAAVGKAMQTFVHLFVTAIGFRLYGVVIHNQLLSKHQ